MCIHTYPKQKQPLSIGQFIFTYSAPDADTHYALEKAHNYIQWLFPIGDISKATGAKGITAEDLNKIKASDTCKTNIIKALKIMLRFWGGTLEYTQGTWSISNSRDVQERLTNLKENPHNNRRISRVISCLVLIGKTDVARAVLDFFTKHVNENKIWEKTDTSGPLWHWKNAMNASLPARATSETT